MYLLYEKKKKNHPKYGTTKSIAPRSRTIKELEIGIKREQKMTQDHEGRNGRGKVKQAQINNKMELQ